MSTITFSLKDTLGVGIRARIALTPKSTPFALGSDEILSSVINLQTDGSGAATATGVEPGLYGVAYPGFNSDGYTISVPNDSATYAATAISSAVAPTFPLQFIVNGIAAGLTGLVGGANKLDGVPTVGAAGSIWLVYDAAYGGFRQWYLEVSNHASDPANGYLRPLDYGTSGLVWVAIS